MIKTYETVCFEKEISWDAVPEGKIDCFQWESEKPYRPESSFRMCMLKNRGIFVRMKTDEKNIRALCTKRDEPCYEDSCMEFFLKPFQSRSEYINFEINPAAAYLSAFGKDRESRIYLKSLTDEKPVISTQVTSDGWTLELQIPDKLITEVFAESFTSCAGEYRGNFFKCGDKTQTAHFGSFSPMGTLPPGFHAPSLFARIKINSEK